MSFAGCGDSSPDAGRASSPDRESARPLDDAPTSTSRVPAAPAGPLVRVVAAGDIACVPGRPPSASECQQEATAQLVERLDAAFVLALGDLQYERGEGPNFEQSYDASWGRFKSRTRPAPGNHEYAGGRARGYFGYFDDAAHPAGGWYSFDVPEVGWHVIVLNSVCSVVGCGQGSEQLTWLRADLDAHADARCTLAAWHHPRWSSGLHGVDDSTEHLWRELAAAGAELVVSGHDHHYERLAPRDGVRQFVAGTGGRNLYPVVRKIRGSEFVTTDHFGVLELELRDGSYTWRFHAINNGGVLDQGTAPCT